MPKCSYCENDQDSQYPPSFVIWNIEEKCIEKLLCAQCMRNLEIAMLELKLVLNKQPTDAEICF